MMALAALTTPARADAPVEHEFIPPDADEDLALQATTPRGNLPAALETPSGVVRAPDTAASPPPSEATYGGDSTPMSADAVYRIDRNTTRPDLVGYSDPFRPTVTPFKRLYAFDTVDGSLELVVGDRSLSPIAVGGEVLPGDDQFYADMTVDLARDVPVRIPSVGPGARALAAESSPELPFQLFRDGADNWFIRASARERIRLTMQLAIPRAVFGSPFADVSWPMLTRFTKPVPEPLRAPTAKVLGAIGVDREMSPRQALTTLVGYFRGFKPSDELPSSSGAALYEELALLQKGVCRHRAYAFTITAQALGLPARLIRNEAHAWVEVYDSRLWHRIDLGGAAGRLDTEQPPDTPLHAPPADPFAWPKGSESGSEMVGRSGLGEPGAPPGASAAMTTPPPPPAETSDPRPAAELTVDSRARDVMRGEPLELRGRVAAGGEPCARARVDVTLRAASGGDIPIGSLAADADGRFSGSVVVPLAQLAVGDYELTVSTPGDARCGPGSAK